MKIKAFITAALVLGSSSMALASNWQPQVRDHRTTVATRDNEASTQRPRESYYPHPAPVHVVKPINADGFRTVSNINYAFDGVKTIDFGCEGQYVNTLRIFSADQSSEVARVVVHKMDGTSYDYLWNHVFATANDGQQGPFLAMVPLTQVKSIDVYARNASNSTFAVQIKA